MDMPDDSGSSRREHLMQVLENTPEDSELYYSTVAQIEEIPEIPFYIEHVWNWFWQIHQGRTDGMSGPNPLTWHDLYAWQNVLQIQVRPFEFELIREIDSVYLKYINDKQEKKRSSTKGSRNKRG